MSNIHKLAKHNGLPTVKYITKLELMELYQAIESNIDQNIIDELADVIVTTKQLIHLMGIEQAVDNRIEYKIKRQYSRFGME